MRAKKFFLIGKSQLDALFQFLHTLELKGKFKVTISDAGSKSDRQHGLYWLWATDVSNSGMGGEYEDTKEGVHRIAKWRWARPILLRDDDLFPEIYTFFMDRYGKDPAKMKKFIDTWISTSGFSTDQMAEYLSDLHRYYSSHGVNLSDPDDWKLLQSRKRSNV